MSWMCPKCSTYNDDSDAVCVACDAPRPADIKVSGYSAGGSSGSSDIKFVTAKEEPKPKPVTTAPKYESKSKSAVKYVSKSEPKEEKKPLYVAEKTITDAYEKMTATMPKESTSEKADFSSISKKTATKAKSITYVGSSTTATTSTGTGIVAGKIFDAVSDGDTDQFLDSIGYNIWFWGTRAFYALIILTIVIGFFTHGGVWYFGQTVIPGIKAVFSQFGINWAHIHDAWKALRELAGSNIAGFLNR